jgi:hypothetical protein
MNDFLTTISSLRADKFADKAVTGRRRDERLREIRRRLGD